MTGIQIMGICGLAIDGVVIYLAVRWLNRRKP